MATLARCQLQIMDDAGNIIDGASVEVRNEDTLALPQVYSDRAGTIALGNPFTVADGADAGFYVIGGPYKITATLGSFERIWRHVAVGTLQEHDTDFVTDLVDALLGGGEIVYPLETGADDWPGLYAKLVANAYGRPTIMAAGAWECQSFAGSNGINVPSGSHIIGTSGTIIESTLTPSGGQTTSVFSSVTGTPAGSSNTTLSAQADEGDSTITLTSVAIKSGGANIAIDDTLLIFDGGNMAMYSKVLAINTGTKVVTLDRPLITTFESGDLVGVRTVPTDIRIDGNGMTIRGTGDRALNFSAAFHCHIQGVRVEPNDAGDGFDDTVVAYDIGSRFSTFRDIKVDGGGTCLSCISLEGADSCVLDNFEARRSGNVPGTPMGGVFLACSYNNKITKGRIIDCAEVIVMQNGGPDIYGCRYNQIDDITSQGAAAGAGLHVYNGSSFNQFSNCHVFGAATFGILIGGGLDLTEPTRGNSFTHCTIRNCTKGAAFEDMTVAGAVLIAPQDNRFVDITAEDNGTVADGVSVGFTAGVRSTYEMIKSIRSANTGINVGAGASADLSNIYLEYTANGDWAGIRCDGDDVQMDNVRALGGGTGTKVIIAQNSGTLIYDKVTALGAWTYGYASGNAASVSKRGFVNFAACTNQFDTSLGTHTFNPGTLFNTNRTTAGTANAQTLTTGESLPVIFTGLTIRFKVGTALTNSGATTINVDGAGAAAVVMQGGAALTGGELVAGYFNTITWNGSAWVLLDFAVGWVGALPVARGGTGGTTAVLAQAGLGLREHLTAARTYYVRTDGSDSNTGLVNTAGGAFLTIQKAIDVACALDMSIFGVTVQVGAGTYTGANTLKSYVGVGPILILGDETTPGNVIISTSGSCFTMISGAGVMLYQIRGMKLTSSAAHCINVAQGGFVSFQKIEFGAAALAHLCATRLGIIFATGAYAISAGAANHIQCESGSHVVCAGRTVTITGTPAFTTSFVATKMGATNDLRAMTFSGSATGVRYTANSNAVIDTAGGGASYLPGNAAGSTLTGGQYV